MATKSGLIRSFYGWLTKVDVELPPSRILPANRPTSLVGVAKVAERTRIVLVDSPFESRAVYWATLFEKIMREGWKGESRVEDVVQESIWQELNNGHMAL